MNVLRSEFKDIIRLKNEIEHARARNDLVNMNRAIAGFVLALRNTERSGALANMNEYETYVWNMITICGYKSDIGFTRTRILNMYR